MSTYHNQAIAYRPEIDGLRAVAVLPVILFHAGFDLFSGGYVGVDVFFVISGYLITSIILREMEQGKFSIARFYERRARRILPALFFVIVCCLPFAVIWMASGEIKRFGQAMIAVSLFASNVFFWKTTNYFAPAAEEEPLLHTWSLAVEEQYYVLFPLFLMLCWRFGRSRLFWLTALAALLSLGLAEWGWRNQPVANFYLLPTRAWELLAGSLLAFFPKQLSADKRTGRFSEIASVLGILAIVYSIFYFDTLVPFPSVYATVPVIGACLIIAFSSGENIVGRLLSSRLFVFIGLISYSAYLWHQPILAFLRLRGIELTIGVSLFAVFLTLALAKLTVNFVEIPFRTGSALKLFDSFKFTFNKSARARVFIVAVTGLGLLSSGGYSLHLTEGVLKNQDRLRLAALENYDFLNDTECHISEDRVDTQSFACDLGDTDANKSVLLMGDSHLSMILGQVDSEASERSINVKSVSSGYCIPGLGLVHSTNNRQDERCMRVIEESFALVKEHSIKEVGIIARYSLLNEIKYNGAENRYYLANDDQQQQIARPSTHGAGIVEQNVSSACKSLDNTITRLTELGVEKIVLGGPTPEVGRDFQRGLSYWLRARQSTIPHSQLTKEEFEAENKQIFACMNALEDKHSNLTVFYPHIYYLSESDPRGGFRLNLEDGFPVFSDSDHFYGPASKPVAERFLDLLG
ncbi:acyltransferase family protein [Limnobacter sp.]|uniref:acyltransferase family protein n=1 Tax=Limnobacter sp. TaxID=2003368 RepID=UPI002734290E|nr:acyltransferase family protein [Limnobacter sp.]MDP3272321.1 acyltransferase family protein [Limnobacter sp.]